ncbi:MAG: peptidoglycan editing factor PgeF, partial [Proteobacteria bacterium]|nr:peptidoglycan editing factor PgeF [Pseudomonadota bacterium]
MATTLELLTHDALFPLTHGFFSRRGGASSGIFQGLNCGQGSSDQSEAVAINRARVASRIGVAVTALVGVSQIHSADVVTVTGPLDRPPRADAMVTDRPGLALTVLTADCQPVLLADPEAGVIGAAHAGWRGALAGILGNTVRAMEAIGAKAPRIRAVIGPTISQRAYEVGPEFMDSFLAEDPGYDRFFAARSGDRVHFDLPSFG